MAKMDVKTFVDRLTQCVDDDGIPNKRKMLAFIGFHAAFYLENFPAIELELNKRCELERLALSEGGQNVDE